MNDEEFAARRYRAAAARIDKEQLREAIRDWDWTRSTADAFIAQITEALLQGRGWRFSQPSTLHPYFERASLPMDGQLERSLSDAWERSSFWRCEAFDRMVLDTFHGEGHLDFENVSTFLSIIQNLGKTN